MRPALGKGLSALISDETAASVAAAPVTTGITTLRITDVQPDPKQPRRHFTEAALAELASSIRLRGILQPILVSPLGDGTYQLIAGERRWRAAQQAGLTDIPALIKKGSETERFQMALIENIQREDLNPIELAEGFLRLIHEFKMTQEEVAKVVGKDRAVVANTIRLMGLSDPMKDALRNEELTAGHARALVAIEDPLAREALFRRILSEQLTVRDVESAVREHKDTKPKRPASPPPSKSPEARALEENLQQTLARKVELQLATPDSTKGWLRLEFYSLDDLDQLVFQIKRITRPS